MLFRLRAGSRGGINGNVCLKEVSRQGRTTGQGCDVVVRDPKLRNIKGGNSEEEEKRNEKFFEEVVMAAQPPSRKLSATCQGWEIILFATSWHCVENAECHFCKSSTKVLTCYTSLLF